MKITVCSSTQLTQWHSYFYILHHEKVPRSIFGHISPQFWLVVLFNFCLLTSSLNGTGAPRDPRPFNDTGRLQDPRSLNDTGGADDLRPLNVWFLSLWVLDCKFSLSTQVESLKTKVKSRKSKFKSQTPKTSLKVKN